MPRVGREATLALMLIRRDAQSDRDVGDAGADAGPALHRPPIFIDSMMPYFSLLRPHKRNVRVTSQPTDRECIERA
ncbi:hypothetical protein EVAR_68172_1, partial [Eumeta japonica]